MVLLRLSWLFKSSGFGGSVSTNDLLLGAGTFGLSLVRGVLLETFDSFAVLEARGDLGALGDRPASLVLPVGEVASFATEGIRLVRKLGLCDALPPAIDARRLLPPRILGLFALGVSAGA